MATLSITPSDVRPSAQAILIHGIPAYVEIAAGKAVYLRTDSTWALAVAAIGYGGTGETVGIALNHAYAGQPLSVVIEDPELSLGSVMVKGEAYWVSPSPNDGLIAPTADVGVLWYRVNLGTAKSTSLLTLDPYATGATG